MEQWQAEITALAAASALSETVYWSAQYLQKAHTRHDSPNHSSLVEAWGLAFQYVRFMSWKVSDKVDRNISFIVISASFLSFRQTLKHCRPDGVVSETWFNKIASGH